MLTILFHPPPTPAQVGIKSVAGLEVGAVDNVTVLVNVDMTVIVDKTVTVVGVTMLEFHIAVGLFVINTIVF